MKLFRQKILPVLAVVCCLSFVAKGQELYAPNLDYSLALKQNYYLVHLPADSSIKMSVHTSQKPWPVHLVLSNGLWTEGNYMFVDFAGDTTKKPSWLRRKLTRESLFIVNDNDVKLTIDPLFNFNLKHSFTDSTANHFQNTRALQVRGSIGSQLYFETSFYESQAGFVDYVNNYVKTYRVVPGLIRVKNFKSSSYDYGIAYGLLSYTPKLKGLHTLNIQLGNDKKFFGDGYRSLLLSDCSSPYPYLSINWRYKKLSYTCLFTSFQNISDGNIIHYDTLVWNAGYQKKTGTFHYLSYKPGNRLDISLFEATLWQVADSGGRRFNPDFFNPLPLVHTAEFIANGKNYTLLGLNLLFKAFNKLHFYGQFAMDDIGGSNAGFDTTLNRKAFQLGAEGFDMFGLNNLNLQAEYNQAQPYMYTHMSPSQSYTHYNQPLADPLGANFREAIGILRYHYRRYFVRMQINYARYGKDTAGTNYGKNIFLSDLGGTIKSGGKVGQGIATTLKYADVCVSYLLNPVTNMNIFVGATYRNESNSLGNQGEKFIYFGFRTSLLNEYFDF